MTGSSTTPNTAPNPREHSSNWLYDIERLKNDGSNFQNWSSQTRLILRNRGLWRIVDGSETAPPATDINKNAEGEQGEWDAQAQILLTLESDPYTGVSAAVTAKEAWDGLHARYRGTTMQVAALQLAAIFHASLADDSPFESQINSILERWRILQSLSITLDESVIAIAIIIALPEAYSTLKSILLSQSTAPKIDSVKNSILAEEQVRMATTGATAIALKANIKGKPSQGKQDAK